MFMGDTNEVKVPSHRESLSHDIRRVLGGAWDSAGCGQMADGTDLLRNYY